MKTKLIKTYKLVFIMVSHMSEAGQLEIEAYTLASKRISQFHSKAN